MTNKEWFFGLPIEKQAEVLSQIMFDSTMQYLRGVC